MSSRNLHNTSHNTNKKHKLKIMYLRYYGTLTGGGDLNAAEEEAFVIQEEADPLLEELLLSRQD